MEQLATIETIRAIRPHPNADRLDIATVLGYEAIVGRDAHREGERIVFIQPDTVLPVDREWAADSLKYLKGGNRLRAVRLRGEWSMGLVMPLSILDVEALGALESQGAEDGTEVSEVLGIIKYEAPLPRDLKAKGLLPLGMPRTDEQAWQNVRDLGALLGKPVDVTLKIDGSSFTAYCILPGDHPGPKPLVGVTSRTLDLKLSTEDGWNPWLEAAEQTDVLAKLRRFCEMQGVSLALRGEVYGKGVQSSAHNPHSKTDRAVAFFSSWNFRTREYEGRDSPLYYRRVCEYLELPEVPLLAEDQELTRELISAYDSELDALDGQPFEGVVLKGATFSLKIKNKHYDSRK